MATIEDLARLVPPPPAPVHASGDWAAAEASLGVTLPADYRELVGTYGLGQFGDITLLTPFAAATSRYADLVWQAGELLDRHREVRREFPEAFPYALHPEPGGLLQWAGTGNGVLLCWLTEGVPDTWPVVVFEFGGRCDRYDTGAVDLLYGHLSAHQPTPGLGETHAIPWFDAARERDHVYVRLSDSDRPYDERLHILRTALAPTADRGNFTGDHGRQDHFKAIDRDWLLTYETAYGHQIRVEFPPDDAATARAVITAAAHEMGCTIRATTTHNGAPTWIGS
ncbi:SMI1/KNR4 family protein [Micromonospora sp. WMMD812]|uniref:SMI1/KNR4 family protein n=1 Tax=Micromonospora sp. WMMD812 TaxID=3015152 RepID=UPI00248CF75D|nr:SMI1/KNR4 family protein [Micromonospora sp. WMMD812]WBB65540.1 SMI1/KNR4 family protein [Micromonospora sp. WMMD812]